MGENLEECKATILGIINSSPNELTVNQLYHDHRALAGTIPFRELGYRSLHEFLLSIPDTVRLRQPHDSNSIVYGVQTKETRHIRKLVKGQKQTSKKPQRSGFNARQPQYRRPPITHDFRKDVFRFLCSCPTRSIDIRTFENQVRKLQYNHHLLDYEFSEILNNIRDVVDIHYRTVRLKTPRIVQQNLISEDQKPRVPPEDIDLISEELNQTYEDIEQFVLEDDVSCENSDAEASTNGRHSAPRSPSSETDAASVHLDEFVDDNPLVSQHLINNLRSLLDDKSNANGIWATSLTTRYSLKFGYTLQPESHGFTDVMDLVFNLPHVFVTKQYRQEGDHLLLDARRHRREAKENEPQGEITKTLLLEMKKMLRKIKQVYADELAVEYKRMYQKTLKPEDYGFKSMDLFLQTLNEASNDIIFRSVRNRTLILLNFCPSDESSIENSQQNGDDAILGSYNINLFPKEVCGPDFKLEPEPFVNEVVPGQRFRVLMGEIYSPGKFFIHLKENESELTMMMDDLDKFYTTNEEEYEICSSALVTRGLLCACPFSADLKWHRVRIMNSRLTKAKVLFIDYGTVEDVDVGKLRYLHKDFVKHPPLCLRAKLAGVGPKKNAESGTAASYGKVVCDRFYLLTEGGELEAELVKYDVKSQCLEISLYRILDESMRFSVAQKLIENDLVEERDIVEDVHPFTPVPDPIPIVSDFQKSEPVSPEMSARKTEEEMFVSSATYAAPVVDVAKPKAPTPSDIPLPSAMTPSRVPLPGYVLPQNHDPAQPLYMNGTTSQRTQIPTVGTQPLGPPPGLPGLSPYRQLLPQSMYPGFYNQVNPAYMIHPELQYSAGFYNLPFGRPMTPMMPTAQYTTGPAIYPYYSTPIQNPPTSEYAMKPLIRPPPGLTMPARPAMPVTAAAQPYRSLGDANSNVSPIPANGHCSECTCQLCLVSETPVANKDELMDDDLAMKFMQRVAQKYKEERELQRNRERVDPENGDDVYSRSVSAEERATAKLNEQWVEKYTQEREELQKLRELVESESLEDVLSKPVNSQEWSNAEHKAEDEVKKNENLRERLAVESKLKDYFSKDLLDDDSFENLHVSMSSGVSRSSSKSSKSACSMNTRLEPAANEPGTRLTDENMYAHEFVPRMNSTSESAKDVFECVLNDQQSTSSKCSKKISKSLKLHPIKDFVLKYNKQMG